MIKLATKPKFITFDCYGTLAQWHRALRSGVAAVLAAHDKAAEADEGAREHVRSLVKIVTLFEAEDGFRIKVRGELANILSLAAGSPRKAKVMCEQIKMVAGACSHLYRTRFPSYSAKSANHCVVLEGVACREVELHDRKLENKADFLNLAS